MPSGVSVHVCVYLLKSLLAARETTVLLIATAKKDMNSHPASHVQYCSIKLWFSKLQPDEPSCQLGPASVLQTVAINTIHITIQYIGRGFPVPSDRMCYDIK